jgi:hypothetical protein
MPLIRHLSIAALAQLVACGIFLGAWLVVPPAQSQTPQQQNGSVMEEALALALIRDTLIALNHANWTGNYSVFRDYAAPSFATANDPVKLTAIFQPIRAAGLDMLPVLVLQPHYSKVGPVDEGRRFRLNGFFPSQPKHIGFDLVYEPVNNRWKLYSISVAPLDPAGDETVMQGNPENPLGTLPGPRGTIPVPEKRPST